MASKNHATATIGDKMVGMGIKVDGQAPCCPRVFIVVSVSIAGQKYLF